MTTNAELIERIDFEKIMPMPRYAGGHDDQMQGLLKDTTVVAHWNEGDYQGQVATCLKLNDTGEHIVISDYYGSCSGCDAWEDARDEDVKRMCIQMAGDAKIFKTLEEVKLFLSHDPKGYDDWKGHLLEEINNPKKD